MGIAVNANPIVSRRFISRYSSKVISAGTGVNGDSFSTSPPKDCSWAHIKLARNKILIRVFITHSSVSILLALSAGIIFQLINVKFPAFSTAFFISLTNTFVESKRTVNNFEEVSKDCFSIPFSPSRALPILFGQPIHRKPPFINIPSTLKLAVTM
jgi:xanthosine utilization system XapX-like protein